MDAAAWLVEFEARAQRWRDERDARWAAIAEQAQSSSASSSVAPAPVVFASSEVELDDPAVPDSARKLARAGLAADWSARIVAAVALDVGASKPSATVTVRLARQDDERMWAGWLNGGFDTSWYVGPSGLERLAATSMATRAKLAQTAADRAAALATVIPYVIGPPGPAKPVTVRGVMDAIEGIRGPRQWVSLFDAEQVREMARAAGVLRVAFPGLQLVSAA